MIECNLDTRAGRMLAAGQVTVTARSRKTGTHITLQAKSLARIDDRWEVVPVERATLIVIDVPNADGYYADKVAKITRNNGFKPYDTADPARVWTALQMLSFVAGKGVHPQVEMFEVEKCGVCGRTLTDPESIERGIGPICYGRMTNSQHQVKDNHDWYAVEMNGWNKFGELVEDSTDVKAPDEMAAIDVALPKMVARSGIVEVGDVKVNAH